MILYVLYNQHAVWSNGKYMLAQKHGPLNPYFSYPAYRLRIFKMFE